MVVTLLDIRCSLIDEAILMHDQIMLRLMRRSQRKYAEQFQENSKRTKRAIKTFTLLNKALYQARTSRRDIWETIEEFISWAELQAIAKDAENLLQAKHANHLYLVQEYYPQIRRYAPAMIEEFDFQAASGGRDIVQAINILRELDRKSVV